MKFTITDKPRLKLWLRAAAYVIAGIVLAGAIVTAFGCSSGGDKPKAQKADELAGIWLAYADTAKDAAAQADAIKAAIALLGADPFSVGDVTPTATGTLLAQKLVESHPELAPHEALIAKLYTLAVYG